MTAVRLLKTPSRKDMIMATNCKKHEVVCDGACSYCHEELKQKADKLAKALAFYADPKNWELQPSVKTGAICSSDLIAPVKRDNGYIAQKALEEFRGE